MNIGGLAKLTLLDYPGKVACTVFTVGCNLRCPFCHNAGLVESCYERLSEEDILAFLNKRKNVLEGMCLTGGEPLLQNTQEFLRKVKQMGYSVKLDTNGTFPDKLRSLVELGLVDYVAMDVKNCKRLYSVTSGCNPNLHAVEQSVNFLKSGVVAHEFRTTITGNFHDEQSMKELAEWLQSDSPYFLQKFVNSGNLLDDNMFGIDDEQMEKFRQIVLPFLPKAQLRGV